MEEVYMKRPGFWVAVALGLCLLSSVGANLVQTDGRRVAVTEVLLPGSDGAFISGLMFRPVKATAQNPLPLIIAAHGSYNSKEMQAQNLVELSRRGFIVFAPDSYRHGKSSIHNGNIGEYASLVDTVEALSRLNYIDPDKIALSGHSMGADQSNNTARDYIIKAAQGKAGPRIAAVLSVGCDPPYTDYKVEGQDAPVPVAVDYGVIEAKHDEWFFKQKDVGMDPARYLESANAKAFIEQTGVTLNGAVENGKIYEGQIGGKNCKRVIYQSPEIHPLNYYSRISAASEINFFYSVFGTPHGYAQISPWNQIWFLREIFCLIGLVGFFLFLFPFSCLIMKTGFFKELAAPAAPAAGPLVEAPLKKASFWIMTLIEAAIPALLLMPVGFALIGQKSFVPFIYSPLFGEPNTNELAGWSAAIAVCLLALQVVQYLAAGKKNGASLEAWGYRASGRKIWKALLLGFATTAGAYLLVFISEYIFGTDFRFWVVDVKTFDAAKLQYGLVYFPAFALFYLVNSLLINATDSYAGWKEWQKEMLAVICNILGLAVLVYIQYSGLFRDGTEVFNAMRIVNLFPLFVMIPVATIIGRRFYRETGSIYAGSFVFGFLYAMMNAANTMFIGGLF